MANWRALSYNRLHAYWFKKFTTLHEKLVQQLKKCIHETHVPEWMTKDRTTLVQNTQKKGPSSATTEVFTYNVENTYTQLREQIYHNCRLLPEEQKGRKKGKR